MCNEIPNVNILATNEEMVAHMRIANWTAPIYNISGLSFGKEEVQSRVAQKPFAERKHESDIWSEMGSRETATVLHGHDDT